MLITFATIATHRSHHLPLATRLRAVSHSCYVALLALFTAMLTASCGSDKGEDVQPQGSQVLLRIAADWRQADAVPTGMTLVGWPHADGQRLLTLQTADVDATSLAVDSGRYDLFLFSQTVAELPSIAFSYAREGSSRSGRELQVALRQTTVPTADSLLYPRLFAQADLQVAAQPDPLAAAVVRNVTAQTDTTIAFHPQPVVQTASVRVYVRGIGSVEAVRASLYGTAAATLVGSAVEQPSAVYLPIGSWSRQRDEAHVNDGYLCATIRHLGYAAVQPELVLQLRIAPAHEVLTYRYLLSPADITDGNIALHRHSPTAPDALPELAVTTSSDDLSAFDVDIAPWVTTDTIPARF